MRETDTVREPSARLNRISNPHVTIMLRHQPSQRHVPLIRCRIIIVERIRQRRQRRPIPFLHDDRTRRTTVSEIGVRIERFATDRIRSNRRIRQILGRIRNRRTIPLVQAGIRTDQQHQIGRPIIGWAHETCPVQIQRVTLGLETATENEPATQTEIDIQRIR